MKKIILFFTFMTGIISTVYSQGNTNYGVNSGADGRDNSFFGYYAGFSAGQAYPEGNSFFGSNSGRANIGSNNTGIGFNALRFNTTGGHNTAVGVSALQTNTTGLANTAIGIYAMSANTTGSYNVAMGHRSLIHNQTGNYNCAIGNYSLYGNQIGSHNTASGYHSLHTNTSGNYNTASGSYCMDTNTTGSDNTARGYYALYANVNGSQNTVAGSYSMYTNSSGYGNTASGYRSLYSNTTGANNTALGSYSMYSNVNGTYNTATGYYAISDNTTGSRNSASGFRALDNNTTGSYNTAQGAHALNYVSTGNYNSALGYDAGPTLADLTNTTAIGYLAVPTASNQVRIGNVSVTSIGGQVEWTAFSDGRFKRDIKEDVSGLEFINHLRPVSYVVDKTEVSRFLQVTDSSGSWVEGKSIPIRQTGFIAQEVDALVKKTGYVFSGIDAPKNDNDPYGIRYSAFVVPLVKAVQELSAKVEEQQQQIQALLAQLYPKDEIATNVTGGNSYAVLLQNNPNPFNAETEIKMTIPEKVGTATIMIYNLEGKQMKSLHVNDRGEVLLKISGNELAAGMYLYSLIVDGKLIDTKRMILTH